MTRVSRSFHTWWISKQQTATIQEFMFSDIMKQNIVLRWMRAVQQLAFPFSSTANERVGVVIGDNQTDQFCILFELTRGFPAFRPDGPVSSLMRTKVRDGEEANKEGGAA